MAARGPRRKPAADASAAPRGRRRALLALGLLALVAFTLATLPASLAARFLRDRPVAVESWSGTVWSGIAHGVVSNGVPVGDLRWTLHPLALFTLRLAAGVEITRPDGRATLEVSARNRESVELTDVDLDLPLSALGRSPSFGWNGRVQGRLDSVTLVAGWPTAVRGALTLRGVTAPAPMSGPLGDFAVTFPDPKPPTAATAGVSARITGGTPLVVDASLKLGAGRSFEIAGIVTGTGSVPPALERALGALGPPDAAGRREFSASGTL